MRPPRLLNDIYADLRNRRLLPVVVVLLIAIPALPFLLKSDSNSVPPPSATEAAALDQGEVPTLPAVLASDPGLRDYRERLEALRSKNPFAQGSQVPDVTESEIADVGDAGSATPPLSSSGGGSTSSTGTAPSSAEAATTTQSAVPDTVTSDSGVDGGGVGGGGGSASQKEPVSYRADVEVGHAGSLERRRNVKLLTVLPSQSNPVAIFIGATEDGKRAVFLVSEDVVATHGAGSCLPTQADCQFLTLKPGDKRTLDYAAKGDPDRFAIKLVDVSLAPVDEDKKRSKQRATVREDLSAWLGL